LLDYRQYQQKKHLRRLQEQEEGDVAVYEESLQICPQDKLKKEKNEFFSLQCFSNTTQDKESCFEFWKGENLKDPYPPSFSALSLSIQNEKTKKKGFL
jgi:hypothetical protein